MSFMIGLLDALFHCSGEISVIGNSILVSLSRLLILAVSKPISPFVAVISLFVVVISLFVAVISPFVVVIFNASTFTLVYHS